jgi:nucleoside 2-deoxyribosyltransferase
MVFMRTPQEISEYIKAKLRETGEKPNTFLRRCRLDKSLMSTMSSGSMPSADKIFVMAKELCTTMDEMLDEGHIKDGQNTSDDESSPVTKNTEQENKSTVMGNSEQNDTIISSPSLAGNRGQAICLLCGRTDASCENMGIPSGMEIFSFKGNNDLPSARQRTPNVTFTPGTESLDFKGNKVLPPVQRQMICAAFQSEYGGNNKNPDKNMRRELACVSEELDAPRWRYECPNCGTYLILDEDRRKIVDLDYNIGAVPYYKDLHILSGLARHYHEQGKSIVEFGEHLTNYILKHATAIIPESISDKIKMLMYNHFRERKDILNGIKAFYPALCFAADEYEMASLIRFAHEAGYIENEYPYRPTFKGLQVIETYKMSKTSNSVFVAMWFDNSMDGYYNAVKSTIDMSGFKAIKINDVRHLNDINNEIVALIKNCRFVVADLTGQRNNVYFEVGYAKGIGKPVILTCEEDDFQNRAFDTSTLNTILWNKENYKDLQQDVMASIIANIDGATLIPIEEAQEALAAEQDAPTAEQLREKTSDLNIDEHLNAFLGKIDERLNNMATKSDIESMATKFDTEIEKISARLAVVENENKALKAKNEALETRTAKIEEPPA